MLQLFPQLLLIKDRGIKTFVVLSNVKWEFSNYRLNMNFYLIQILACVSTIGFILKPIPSGL
jgi:hypothetical protein